MNTPLTITELKAIPIKEWVFILHIDSKMASTIGLVSVRPLKPAELDRGMYYRVGKITELGLHTIEYPSLIYHWSNYGETWVAYKNKEDARSAKK